MDFTSLDSMPYYTQCKSLVEGLGYILVSIHVVPAKTTTKVQAVITNGESNSSEGIGINDCAKVHRLLLPRLEALLQNQDIYMEVTSPGMERHIKNAAEFSLFKGRDVKVWNTEISDWISGVIKDSDEHQLTLEVMEETKIIPYTNIAKAKLLQL
ncbi:MAG: ribosome maturation factor [Spirochaetaceae bacterium]|nr:ribosome maturation factor [Spirochaetaceae bacterium]MBP3450102.1 ribosome maturation factor [Spirochaetaceae bacterium]MBQ3025212.1 ribosome maturation factor [Spirochaetaceae bacterium]MBQ7904180.1 ribosome maturation factor [Spirochaetaceae bacterium]